MKPAKPVLSLMFILMTFYLFGCGTTSIEAPTTDPDSVSEAATLMEGDEVLIIFPGAPDLNASQKIRRDGRISVSLIGEVVVTGLTPAQLEQKLLQLYGDQLIAKEVNVTVTSSSYPIYVNGAVLRPGKQLSDRRLTALEAIMEAGGPSQNANIRNVVVTRLVDGEYVNYELDLRDVLSGKRKGVFYLNPSDIITVPEKFVLF